MGIQYQTSNIHWNYYLAIESDFEKISRYIEFNEANNSTFSIELARIIMAGTQEIDGIMKKLCELINSNINTKNIKDYRDVIKKELPVFVEEIVQIPRFGMSSRPWGNWLSDDDNNSPDWWLANNNIKHNRTQNFEVANLKNSFNCVGALLIVTLYYYKLKLEKTEEKTFEWKELTSHLRPKSSLFILNDDYYHNTGQWSSIEW